jgi:hypothetical protein
MLFLTALACSGTALLPSTTAYVIDVFANQGWQETSIMLEEGQQVRVQYLSGQWTDWFDRVFPFGPEGEDYVCPYRSGCCEPLPKEHKGALIGRIGEAVFLIGAAQSFTAPAGGPLDLRMNDCLDALNDNTGFLRIKLVP